MRYHENWPVYWPFCQFYPASDTNAEMTCTHYLSSRLDIRSCLQACRGTADVDSKKPLGCGHVANGTAWICLDLGGVRREDGQGKLMKERELQDEAESLYELVAVDDDEYLTMGTLLAAKEALAIVPPA